MSEGSTEGGLPESAPSATPAASEISPAPAPGPGLRDVLPLAPGAAETSERRRGVLERLMQVPEVGLIAALVLFGAVVQFQNSSFLTYSNLILVLQAASPTFIVAAFATLVFVGGGLDLSVGSVAALGGVVTAALLHNQQLPVVIAIFAGVVATGVVGAVIGGLVARVNIPPLIVTLGALYTVRGLLLLTTNATIIFPLPTGFVGIAQNSVGGVPLLVLYAALAGIVAYVILDRTGYGYRVRAVGGNAASARASGINVRGITFSLYIISGAASGLAGILIAGQTSSADPSTLVGFELEVISAVIIGGTSLFGAVGRIPGTVLGVILLATIDNGLLLARVDPHWQQIVRGLVVIAAVGLDQFRRRVQWTRGR